MQKSLLKHQSFVLATFICDSALGLFRSAVALQIFSGLLLVPQYVVRRRKRVQYLRLSPRGRPPPPPPLPQAALNTGSLSVCIPLCSPSIQSCNSAPCRRSTTATFFSSCWSPSDSALRTTGRRLPARGCPSPSRHTGTTPCFPSESHTQLCPLPLVLPPSGSWKKERHESWGKVVRDGMEKIDPAGDAVQGKGAEAGDTSRWLPRCASL